MATNPIRDQLRQLLMGAETRTPRTAPPLGWLDEPIDADAFGGWSSRQYLVDILARRKFKAARKTSSASVAISLNAAHALDLTDEVVETIRGDWAKYRRRPIVQERIGPIDHGSAEVPLILEDRQ